MPGNTKRHPEDVEIARESASTQTVRAKYQGKRIAELTPAALAEIVEMLAIRAGLADAHGIVK